VKDGEALQFLPVQWEQSLCAVPAYASSFHCAAELLLIQLFGNPGVDGSLMLTLFYLVLACLALLALKG